MATSLYSQSEKTEKSVPFGEVENMPVAPGCERISEVNEEKGFKCFNKYVQQHISENFNFPTSALDYDIYGRIYVKFTINKEAEVEDVSVVRGLADRYKLGRGKLWEAAKELDEEAKRVIELLVIAKPAYNKGKPVLVQFTVPINAKPK